MQRRLALLKLFAGSDDILAAEIALPALAASCDSNEQARLWKLLECSEFIV